MQQHSIPQNIMSYEFKLIGGLTLKQFVFVASGGSIAFVLLMGVNKGFLPSIIGWPLLIIDIILTIVVALVKFQNRSIDVWFKDFTEVFKTPTRRLWKKKSGALRLKNVDLSTLKPSSFPQYLGVYFKKPDDLEDDLADLKKALVSKIAEAQAKKDNPAQQVAPVVSPVPVVPTQITQEIIAPTSINTTAQQAVSPQITPPVQVSHIATTILDPHPPTPFLIVSASNAAQFAVDPQKLLNKLNVSAYQIFDKQDRPMAQIVGIIKTEQNSAMQALKSNETGIIFFDRQLANGGYVVSFHSAVNHSLTFPLVRIVYDGTHHLPVIKIRVV